MSHTPLPDNEQTDDWISLHEASELLGVATSTLRRWGDDGRLKMRRTLGGHRRFLRVEVERLMASAQPNSPIAPRPQEVAPWGVDERELVRQEWHTRLASRSNADRMRGLGQRLLGLLIQYINRKSHDDRFLDEARGVGATYGKEARAANVSLYETVEAFLFFRSAFSQLAMPIPGIAQPTDLTEAVELHGRIDRFMDAVLLGVIDGYENSDP